MLTDLVKTAHQPVARNSVWTGGEWRRFYRKANRGAYSVYSHAQARLLSGPVRGRTRLSFGRR